MPAEREQTLTQLENDDWGPPSVQSHLVTECHRLRKKPLQEFSIEDLRIMIGQGIGLKYLVPNAIERLTEEPLLEGDYYPGDLLNAVLRVEKSYWQSHPDQRRRVAETIARALDTLAGCENDNDVSRRALEEARSVFERSE